MFADLVPTARRPLSWLGLLAASVCMSCFNPGVGGLTDDTTDGTGVGPADTGPGNTDPAGGSTDGQTSTPMTGGASDAQTSDAPGACGDEVLDDGEECDNGSANADDAECKPDCTLASCGDGLVWAGVEECDDGNADDGDACPSTCLAATCGDGFVQAGTEDCDDAGESATCNADCTVAACGDGQANLSAGEQCDDGNLDDTDACPTTCLDATCGDGFVYAGVEQCDGDQVGAATCMDLGYAGSTPGCDAQCSIDPSGCAGYPCPDGGAYVSNYCWYLSAGCEDASMTCGSHGLSGINGYVPTTWDMPVMDEIAAQLGYGSGGVNGCCVQFGWVENNTIYTHNFGPEFYNWNGCYSDNPTIKACDPP